VEDESGDLKEADAAEMRVIEEIRRMGQESLEAWAKRQVEKVSEELDQTRGIRREGKKTLLAYHLWRHRSRGTPIPHGETSPSALCAKRGSQQSMLLEAVTAGSH